MKLTSILSCNTSMRVVCSLAMICLSVLSSSVWAHDGEALVDTEIVPLMLKGLSGIEGKEASMITVEYAPGASTPIHRHNSDVFVYVLEGQITMQVSAGEPVTLGPGETFYESPDDIHAVSKNASDVESAKFLVFLIKDVGVPPVIPVPQ